MGQQACIKCAAGPVYLFYDVDCQVMSCIRCGMHQDVRGHEKPRRMSGHDEGKKRGRPKGPSVLRGLTPTTSAI